MVFGWIFLSSLGILFASNFLIFFLQIKQIKMADLMNNKKY